jgi:hypothetical protein
MIPKDNKQRLFEIMAKIDPTFKPILNEEVIIKKLINESYITEEDIEGIEKPENVYGTGREDAGLPEPEAVDANKEVELTPEEKPINSVNFKVTILVSDEKYADKEIVKLNKMATKFGLPQPIVTKGKKYVKAVTLSDGERIGVDVMDIEINTTGTFKFPGNYRLVAIIDNSVGVAYVIDPKELSTIPEEYLKPCNQCDHCGTQRYRDKTFLVIDEHGKYVRLGSSCVKQFLGINPNKYLSALSYFKLFKDNFGGDEEDFMPHGGGDRGFSPKLKIIETNKAISLIEDIISRDGYEKREWEYPDRGPRYQKNPGTATADKVENIMFTAEEWNKVPVNQEFVDKFMNFVNTLEIKPDQKEDFSEFLTKIKETVTQPKTRILDTAFIAAAINFYHETIKREAKYAVQKGSVFIGKVGEKIKIPYAKLIDMKSGEGVYGIWYLWTLEDENGNIMKKFGELPEKFKVANAPEGAEEIGGYYKGDVFKFTTDIKKQEEFRGIKTTQLGRLSKF